MDAKELLKSIQLLGKNVKSNEYYLQKIIRESKNSKYNFLIDKIKETNSKLPTDYQESHFYSIIEDSFSILEEIINLNNIQFHGQKIELKALPVYGTVDWDSYNAFVKITNNNPIIVFNNGLLKFTDRIIKLIVEEIYLKYKNILDHRYQELFTKHFIDIMLCYHLYCDAYRAIPIEWCGISDFNDLDDMDKVLEFVNSEPVLYDETYTAYNIDLENATYLWIAAHEYSHIILNHTESANLVHTTIGSIAAQKMYFNWNQEYEADLLGAVLTMQNDKCYYSANGIYLALNCILLSDYNNLYGSESHPPIKRRIERILDYLNKSGFKLTNYKSIDAILTPKFVEYKRFMKTFDYNNFNQNLFDIQRYLYKEYVISEI